MSRSITADLSGISDFNVFGNFFKAMCFFFQMGKDVGPDTVLHSTPVNAFSMQGIFIFFIMCCSVYSWSKK